MTKRAIMLSLEVAEFAAAAVASLASLQRNFDQDLDVPLQLGLKLLNGSTAIIFAKPAPVRRRPEPVAEEAVTAVVKILPARRKAPEAEDEEDREERSAWEPSSPFESSRCKALLLEVLRRAAHDWVLYRGHSEITKRECAQDAYTWLFKEDEEHAAWRQRSSAVFDLDEGEAVGARCITSFLTICEILDLDPETVRARVRTMTVQTIISAGRPAETRKTKRLEVAGVDAAGLTADIDVEAMPRNHAYDTQYESYGSIATPDMLSINDVSSLY